MNTREIARRAVESSAVLLKNQGLLPLAQGQKVAFFGWAQLETVLSGNGSGVARGTREVSILESCREAGLVPVACLEEFYRREIAQRKASQPSQEDPAWLKEAVNSGLMYEIFGKHTPNPEEFPLPEDLVRQAAAETSTAVWVLGRKSGGEECDRHLDSDFFLSPEETALLDQLCGAFDQVAVVLNVNDLLDLSWAEERPQVKSLLFLGIPGGGGPGGLGQSAHREGVPLRKALRHRGRAGGGLPGLEGLLLGQGPFGVHPHLPGLRPDAPGNLPGVCPASRHRLPGGPVLGLPVL